MNHKLADLVFHMNEREKVLVRKQAFYMGVYMDLRYRILLFDQQTMQAWSSLQDL